MFLLPILDNDSLLATDETTSAQPANSALPSSPALQLTIVKAVGWTLMTLLLQLVAFAIAWVLMTASADNSQNAGFRWQVTLLMQGLFLGLVMLTCRWSLKHSLDQILGTQRLKLWHATLILLLVIPMALLGSQLHVLATSGWQKLLVLYPQLEILDGRQSMEMVSSLMSSTPLWAMLIMIAVIPALAEELIFRGMISRGVTARYGFWTGMIVSTILFAMVHMHPVHALALIPMGCILHLIYFATRSFWAPVLLHFCNNGLAVLMSSLALQAAEMHPEAAKSTPPFSAIMLISCLLGVTVLISLLWHSRVKSETSTESGTSEWSLGVMSPPEPSSTEAIAIAN